VRRVERTRHICAARIDIEAHDARDSEARVVQQNRGQHAEPAAEHEHATEIPSNRIEQRVGEPHLARDLIFVERFGERRFVAP
jgi:hypothetical protein